MASRYQLPHEALCTAADLDDVASGSPRNQISQVTVDAASGLKTRHVLCMTLATSLSRLCNELEHESVEPVSANRARVPQLPDAFC